MSDDQPKKKRQPVPKADDIVNMKSWGGLAADLLSPTAFGGERAGRSQTLGTAAGMHVPFSVRHPVISSILPALIGSMTGGAIAHATGSEPQSYEDAQKHLLRLFAGSAIGGSVGALGAGAYRRSKMKDMNEAYDAAADVGELNPKRPQLSTLAGLLLPGRGPHRRGQIEALQSVLSNEEYDMPGERRLLYAAQHIPGGVGDLVNLIGGYGQNLTTHADSSRMAREENKQRMRAMYDMKKAGTGDIHKAAAVIYARKKQAAEAAATSPVDSVLQGLEKLRQEAFNGKLRSVQPLLDARKQLGGNEGAASGRLWGGVGGTLVGAGAASLLPSRVKNLYRLGSTGLGTVLGALYGNNTGRASGEASGLADAMKEYGVSAEMINPVTAATGKGSLNRLTSTLQRFGKADAVESLFDNARTQAEGLNSQAMQAGIRHKLQTELPGALNKARAGGAIVGSTGGGLIGAGVGAISRPLLKLLTRGRVNLGASPLGTAAAVGGSTITGSLIGGMRGGANALEQAKKTVPAAITEEAMKEYLPTRKLFDSLRSPSRVSRGGDFLENLKQMKTAEDASDSVLGDIGRSVLGLGVGTVGGGLLGAYTGQLLSALALMRTRGGIGRVLPMLKRLKTTANKYTPSAVSTGQNPYAPTTVAHIDNALGNAARSTIGPNNLHFNLAIEHRNWLNDVRRDLPVDDWRAPLLTHIGMNLGGALGGATGMKLTEPKD